MICFYEMFTGRQDNSFSLFSSGYRGEKNHNSLSCVSFPLTHCHTHNSSDTTFFPYTMQFSVTSARYLTIPFNSILT